MARWRRVVFALISGACLLAATAPVSAATAAAPPGEADVTVHVNANNPIGPLNRALLGWTDMWSLLGTNALGWNDYALSNPSGTLQRQGVDMNNLCPSAAGTCAGGVGLQYDKMFDYVGAAPNAPGFPPAFKNTSPDALLQKMIALGEKPELLFEGRKDLFESDPQAWADIVVQTLRHVEQTDGPVAAIEVWNEPNCCGSQPGSLQQYEIAFAVTAQAVHAQVPGVLVTGPVYCCDDAGHGTDQWPISFLQQDAASMEAFVWHDYGGHALRDTLYWLGVLQQQFQIPQPKLMVTESDWGTSGRNPTGYAKNEVLLQRTFDLIPYSANFVAWDQFHLGTYQGFGMINNNGTVVDKNYWPYWIFRDAAGNRVQTDVSVDAGGNTQDAVGTATADGHQVNLVFYEPSVTAGGAAATAETVRLHVNLPVGSTAQGWVYSLSVLSPTQHAMVQSGTVAAGTDQYDGTVSVVPGEALSLTFRRGAAAASPYVDLTLAGTQAPLGGTLAGDAAVYNTTGQALRGNVAIDGLRSGWSVQFSGGPQFTLAPGQSADLPFTISIPTSAAANVQAVLDAHATFAAGSGVADFTSIPSAVTSASPVILNPIPDYTLIAPGETRVFNLRLSDGLQTPVSVNVHTAWPDGWAQTGPGSGSVTLQPGAPVVLPYTLTAPTGTVAGTVYNVPVQVSIGGAGLPTQNVQIRVADYTPDVPSTPVDLQGLYNQDGFSYDSNPGDGNLDGGGYTLPADTFPSGQGVRYWGVQFQTPVTTDGVKNAVEWLGQSVALPTATTAHALGLLVTATNGDHTGTITLTYADGSTQTATAAVEDWCGSITNPLPGDEPVIHFGHRHRVGNDNAAPGCGIWYVQVPVTNPAVGLTSVTLGSDTNLHLFALSVIP